MLLVLYVKRFVSFCKLYTGFVIETMMIFFDVEEEEEEEEEKDDGVVDDKKNKTTTMMMNDGVKRRHFFFVLKVRVKHGKTMEQNLWRGAGRSAQKSMQVP